MLKVFKFNLKFSIAFLSFAALCLSSCKLETPPVTLTVAPGGPILVNSGSLTCAASTSLSSVTSGESFPVTIQVIGGVGPYSLEGLSGSFLTSYTLPQTVTLSGSTSEITNSSFTVTDSAGNSTTCQLALTVTPVEATDPLSCAVTASDDTPAVNESVTYTATATGGSGTYFFTGFIPGGTGIITASLNQTSPTTATAGAKYPSSGLNTSVFYIADSVGNSATCAKTVTVQSGPAVSLTASPASSIPATQTMTVTATPTGFSGTPTYTFSIVGAGLNLSSSGAVATVTAIDSTITRTGTVSVTAVFGTETATSSIPVTFTAQSSTLNCSMTYTPGTYQPGQTVPFSITASTGEALNVSYIEVQDGYVVGGVPSQNPSVVFYYSGTKYVKALAQSASTGIACNSGNYLQSTIYISPTSTQFSCTLTMTPNPTNTYTWILATAQASGAQGAYWIESLTANNTSGAMVEYETYSAEYYGSPAYRYVYFTIGGNFLVTARLRDSLGRTATCQTYQTIYRNIYTETTSAQFCGIWPARDTSLINACTMELRETWYYDGNQCQRYPLWSGGCDEKGAFNTYSDCVQTVNAGSCRSW